jgi:hypothetical protein
LQQKKFEKKKEKKKKEKGSVLFSLKEFLFGVIIQCFFFLAKFRKLARKRKPSRIQQRVFREFI